MKHAYFTTHKNPVSVVLALLILGGVLAYAGMKKSLFPEITFPKIKVIAENGLQPVNKMMVTVTKPLENAIKKVPGLQYVRSTTSRGSCEISAFMDWNADIDLAKQQIASGIAEIQQDLPPGVQLTIEKMNPSILQVMGYTLESPSRSPIELKQLALNTIKPYLSQVEGVAEVAVMGGRTREYWVELDMQRMSALSITPAMISQAMSRTNFVLSNGYLPSYRRLYLTVTDATINNAAQLRDVVIRDDGKRAVTLKDIAKVEVHPATEYLRINANGKSSLLIGIIKQPDANLLDISQKVEQKVNALKDLLPPDVSVQPYYIQADFVHRAIRSVTDALWIGILLALIVAVVFLRSWKASATILVTIPVTLALTLIMIHVAGYTLNIMTIGALAASIGLIIDDAIVVVEQIHRTHEEHHDEETGALLHKAISYLFPGMIASSVSTIVIFIPFAFMSGVAGAYFKVLANSMIITLVCSFFVTWLGLPVIYLLFSKKERRPGTVKDKPVKQQRWVSFFIRRPFISILIAAGLVTAIVLIIPVLQTGFLPEMDEGAIVLDYSSPPGTSLEETDRMCREVEKIIMSEPDVKSYSRRTGTEMGFFITEPNNGDYLIELKEKRSRTTDEVIDDIREKVEATQPALRVDFGQVIGDQLGDLMTSAQPIEIKIFGDDQQTLNQLAQQVRGIASGIRGTADVSDGIIIAGPSVSVTPHPELLAQYGLGPADLQNQLQMQLEGTVIGSVLEREQLSNIRMIVPGSVQAGVAGLRNTSVFLPGGQLVPVSSVADIKVEKGVAEIHRENLQSIAVVTARLDNRDLGSVTHDIQHAVQNKVFLPKGYHITYGGQYAEQQQSFHELLMILATAALLVFGVMLFLSKDFGVSLLILAIALLGTGGCLLALFLTGTPLNVSSYTGIIMIVGIIGENAVFTFLQFSGTFKESSLNEAVIYAVSTRLRPKLMTAIGAIVALMPLALGIGVGAQLHQPLAIAVIGGFIAALPLLLIVLPSFLRLRYKTK